MFKVEPQPLGRLMLLCFAAGAVGALLIPTLVYGFFYEWSGLLSTHHLSLVGYGLVISAIGTLAGYLGGIVDRIVRRKQYAEEAGPAPQDVPRVSKTCHADLLRCRRGLYWVLRPPLRVPLRWGGGSWVETLYPLKTLAIVFVVSMLVLYLVLEVGHGLRSRGARPARGRVTSPRLQLFSEGRVMSSPYRADTSPGHNPRKGRAADCSSARQTGLLGGDALQPTDVHDLILAHLRDDGRPG